MPVITADDFAQFESVDSGILELVEAGKVSGFSCLTAHRRWPAAAKQITREIQACSDVGLHLDLTDDVKIAASHPWLVVRAFAGQLDRRTIREAICSQLNRFGDAMGRMPDYMDGHRHVHQLPVVRDVLMEVVAERLSDWKTLPWIRVSQCDHGGTKGAIISMTGAGALRQLATRARLATNARLLGSYAFGLSGNAYERFMVRTLEIAQDQDAIMVHPARSSVGANSLDPIGHSRFLEFNFLKRTTIQANKLSRSL